MNLELFIARHYLRAKRGRFFSFTSATAIGGIFVGVSALLITLSIMNGFQNELRRRILGGTPHIIVRRYFNEPMVEHDSVRTILETLPFVKAQAPFVMTKSLIRHRQNVDGVVIRGVRADLEQKITDVASSIVDGEFDLDGGCVLGLELAHNLKARVGDTLIITSPYPEPLGMLPRSRRLILKGIFDLGMYDYNAAIVYMDLKDVQLLFDMENAVSGIQVSVDDVYQAPQYAQRIEAAVGYPFRVLDWIESNHSIFAALRLEKVVTFIVLTLIILVAGFNIVGTLVNIVKKKTKEIGIMRSFGVTAPRIMRIFVYQGTIMGLIGTVLGIGFSVAACYILNRYQFVRMPGDVYFIETLPVEMAFKDFLAVALASVLTSFVATIYPALKAAHLVTVEALRNE